MKNIRMLFLGAGNRLSLIEQFYRASHDRAIELTIFSGEDNLLVPIAHAAQVVLAPKFKTNEFKVWLLDFVKENDINIVIPNMDSATVSLSEMKTELENLGVFVVVSSQNICKVMEDKLLSDRWFKSNEIPTPSMDNFPLILKYRYGFGAKQQLVVRGEEDLNMFLVGKNKSDYIIQEYIQGVEYSVDSYVDRSGQVVGLIPRQRIRVIDGEVNDSLSVRHDVIEKISQKILYTDVGWFGPITLQFIDSKTQGCRIIEINPRFGGGVTHSIYCGLDMPGWIIDEFLGKKLSLKTAWKVNSLMTRCRRDVFHEHIA